MKKLPMLVCFPFLILMAFQVVSEEKKETLWSKDLPLQEALTALGEPAPKHTLHYSPEMAKQGEDIVRLGRTQKANGQQTRYVSKYYACTSCHNLEQEDPDLRFSNPETRLPYVIKKGIPFLQGTTFKGIVNRETWYNDDYVKKYGDEKIEIAHQDLRESIQLCAIECSQGRPMEEWEIDAVLAYYWTLQFDLEDLGLSAADLQRLKDAEKQPALQSETLAWLKSFYLQKSPAHFYDSAPDKKAGYPGLTGNPSNGKDIYEASCLYCHHADGVSHYVLDNSKLSFRNIRQKVTKNSHFSLYQIIPYGTYAIPGHRPYMPHYPLERMSKQQVEDLRAYVEQEAK